MITGDPTVDHLQPPVQVSDAMKRVIDEGKYNGYGPSVGCYEARKAVSEYSQHQGLVTPDDVILCSGCSSSLDLCISVLANPGQNILIPQPGFPIYKTLAEGLGIECRSYKLRPEKRWKIDLGDLESLIDARTAAIVINNSSNPCGSVFGKKHIMEILKIAERHFLPIIADEIYEHLVFPGHEYHSIASLSKNVPILSCSGITKRFIAPGWRLGWIIIHDRHNAFDEVRKGLESLSMRILGPNSLVQGALPAILNATPQNFHENLVESLQNSANVAFQMIREIGGLVPIIPCGAFYMMIRIDTENFPHFSNEVDFMQKLVEEQSLYCLPGSCFGIENYFRIVLTAPIEMITDACERLKEFCEKYQNMLR